MKLRHVLCIAGVCLIIGAGIVAASASTTEMARVQPAPRPERISACDAAILGFIQGLTEYLPVSSTGHLILANYWLGQSDFSGRSGPFGPTMAKTPAVDAFDIVLHLGTFLAVLGLYRKRVVQMARGAIGQDAGGRRLLAALAIAFIPAGGTALFFNHWITENLYNPMTVAAALAVGGAAMIVIEHFFWRRRKDTQRITAVDGVQLWQAVVIGAAQCLALWPGTSRSMVTILAALVVGVDMVAAAEFSFLLALPTIGAATAYEGLKHWHDLWQAAGVAGMAIGLVVTTVVAALAVKGFVKWLSTHGLLPFGIYRIALAAAVYAYFAL
jgi:undecaprenyl-diphosphatase